MTNCVLDASASVDLLLETPTGLALQDHLPTRVTWYAPEHFYAEVAGAIRRAELRDEITAARAAGAFADLSLRPSDEQRSCRCSRRLGPSGAT